MKYKVERILSIVAIVCSTISAITAYYGDNMALTVAWSTAALWSFNSLINLLLLNQSDNNKEK